MGFGVGYRPLAICGQELGITIKCYHEGAKEIQSTIRVKYLRNACSDVLNLDKSVWSVNPDP